MTTYNTTTDANDREFAQYLKDTNKDFKNYDLDNLTPEQKRNMLNYTVEND